MGLARELTMGPRRHRKPRVGTQGDYATLRRLTAAETPDLDAFRQALDRVGAQPGRFRLAEGDVYTAACTRYSELTGTQYGIQRGTY